jgi:hypothetical protein
MAESTIKSCEKVVTDNRHQNYLLKTGDTSTIPIAGKVTLRREKATISLPDRAQFGFHYTENPSVRSKGGRAQKMTEVRVESDPDLL